MVALGFFDTIITTNDSIPVWFRQVQITAVDELWVEQDADGGVTKQIARVRLFFLGFLSGQCILNDIFL